MGGGMVYRTRGKKKKKVILQGSKKKSKLQCMPPMWGLSFGGC